MSNGITSCIVLAGDPKQLPAVTKSTFATKMGFSTSIMERLFTKRLYQRHPITGQYNQKYITQLIKNYRSHAAILNIPNALFYENKLQAAAPIEITDWFIQSKLLPSGNFPIILENVQGYCKRSQADFRYENCSIIDYFARLLNFVSIAQFPIVFIIEKRSTLSWITLKNCSTQKIN